MELLLQLHQLAAGVGCPRPLGGSLLAVRQLAVGWKWNISSSESFSPAYLTCLWVRLVWGAGCLGKAGGGWEVRGPAGLCFSHPGVNSGGLGWGGRGHLGLRLHWLGGIASVPVGRVLVGRISVAVHVGVAVGWAVAGARARTKPGLVVRGNPGPGLTTPSTSGSGSGCHHVGHEVAGREEGGHALTALLRLLARHLGAGGAGGKMPVIVCHLSGLQQGSGGSQSSENNKQ